MSSDSDCFIVESVSKNEPTHGSLSNNAEAKVINISQIQISTDNYPSCLEDQQLQEMQLDLISSVASILCLPYQICRALLRKYYWDKQRVIEMIMDSPSEAYKNSGVANLLGSLQVVFATRKTFTCNICCKDSQNQRTLMLQCGHEFCLNCHKTYYEQNIFEGNVK
ncbi:hypothetical protein DSO57_1016985 [Entomophthora muscae]|uniref:Uncharacterized protein n=1 Tax=Entomophthora muscae TaxID=34485 RepID=A0ACC2RJD0_9FUNG|nr:hypothetical protein DSO57_1016985 [Entomophthora muscae]